MSDASDWTEATDKKTGKTYYYNKKTKKTQWSKPEELGGAAAKAGGAVQAAKKKNSDSDASDKGSDDEGAGGAAGGVDPQEDPKNWSKTKDKKTGKEYYYNKVTKKTSWKKPACMPASDDDEEPAAKKPAAKEEAAAATPADAGDWKETVDKKTGKKYWYNKVTKKTTWKDPTKAADEGSDDGAKKKKKGSDDDSGDDDGSDAGSDDDAKAKPAAAAAATKKAAAAGSDDDEEEEKGTKAESEDDEAVLARQKKESDAEEDNKAEEEEEDEDDPNKNKAPELQGGDSDENEGEEGEEGDDQAHEFKFAKHRKGWFNRTFRVGQVHDDATILTFKKSLIKKALLKQNRDLDQEAVQAFKNVMSYMGDRKSSKPPIEHAKKMLKNLMVAPAGLRDEVYMQLCKQTTRNPRVSSTIKGWELMSYCLATFPPSKHLKGFLTDFIKKTVKEAKDDKVRELAEVCAQRVPKILKMGQRKQVPSRMELECLKDVKPVPIRVSLVNGTFKSFNVDPYTLVKEVQDQLVEKYNLVVTKPFAMYEAAEANVERILDPKDRVLDVQASWENKPREEAGEEEGGGKKGRKTTYDKHKDAGKKVAVRTANFNRFLYKAKLVLKTTNQEIMSDPEAINLIYIQATHDVVTSRYPVNEKDITVLAALQLQATFGDFKRDVHLAGWLAPKIEEFMPKTLLEKKGKKSDKLLKEWEQKILAKYAKVSGFTSLEAKLNYLDYVQEWTFYGSTFFIVEQRQFKDYPSPLTLGINCEGVILMHPEKQTVLENYGFTDIVTWGHSDEKFIVVVGNIVQQRKLIFKTQEGKAMNHLIHDYVKFKVKNK